MNNDNQIIYGRKPISEALNSGSVKRLFALKGAHLDEILKEASKLNVPVSYISDKEMDRMCQGNHQGIAAEVKNYQYSSLEEIIHISKKEEHPIILVLDGITDPHNLGAILRSADIFNVSGIILPKHNSVSLSATVAKTSAGAINYVPVATVNNLNTAIKELKDNGFWIVASALSDKAIRYQDLKYDFKTVLIIGSEGKGVSRLVLENSDFVVKIPMFGKVNSLNASVAAGILLSKIRE